MGLGGGTEEEARGRGRKGATASAGDTGQSSTHQRLKPEVMDLTDAGGRGGPEVTRKGEMGMAEVEASSESEGPRGRGLREAATTREHSDPRRSTPACQNGTATSALEEPRQSSRGGSLRLQIRI